jgi:hypothetical protein
MRSDVGTGDIVLVSLRDFQDGKADIIMKYTADEARGLKNMGELPDTGTPTRLFVVLLSLSLSASASFLSHTSLHLQSLTHVVCTAFLVLISAKINQTDVIGGDDDEDENQPFDFEDI